MGAREWTPGDLFAVSGAYWQGFAVHAAVKLGVFTVLGEDRAGAEEVARRLGANARGTEMLLNALAALGLVSRAEGGFANTPFSRTYLARGSSKYVGHILMHHHFLVRGWSRLDRAVLTGGPTRGFDPDTLGQELESFLMGMYNLASGIAPLAAREVDQLRS